MRDMLYNGRLMLPETITAFIGGGLFLSGNKKVDTLSRYLLIASVVCWLVHGGSSKLIHF